MEREPYTVSVMTMREGKKRTDFSQMQNWTPPEAISILFDHLPERARASLDKETQIRELDTYGRIDGSDGDTSWIVGRSSFKAFKECFYYHLRKERAKSGRR